MRVSVRATAACLMLVAAVSCIGGNHQTAKIQDSSAPQVAVQQPFVLPNPAGLAELLPPAHGSSYIEDDLIRHGAAFESLLDYAHVSVAGDTLSFEGAYSYGSGLDGAAYCVYSFSAQGYDRDPVVRFEWENEPAVPGDLFIGLSNFSLSRWDWYAYDGSGQCAVTSFDDYFDGDGRLLLALVYLGDNEVCKLKWLRLDDDMPLVMATILPDRWRGFSPMNVELDASESIPGAGSFTYVEWDWEGDGTWDADSGTDLTVYHTYENALTYTPKVRLTTDFGIQADSSGVNVQVEEPWTHSWGGSDRDVGRAVVADSEAVYIAGQTKSFGEGAEDALLVKYLLDGTFQWARSWGSDTYEYYSDMVLGSDGLIYAVGATGINHTVDFDMLIQCWDADGNLQWTRTWGEDLANDEATRIACYNDTLYVLGIGELREVGNQDCTLLKFSTAGDLLLVRAFGSGFYDMAGGIALTTFPETKIHIAGQIGYNDSYDTEPLYCQFNDSGDIDLAAWWIGNPEAIIVQDIVVTGLPAPTPYLSGRFDGTTNDILLLEYDPDPGESVAVHYGARLPGMWLRVSATCSYVGGFGDNYALILSGATIPDGGSRAQGFLLCVDSETGDNGGAKLLLNSGDASTSLMGMCAYPGGDLVVAGRTTDFDGLSWEETQFTPSPISGSWQSISIACVAEFGMLRNGVSGLVHDLTSGVLDTTSGESVVLVSATALP